MSIGIPLLLALTASAVVAAGELAIGPGGETEIDRMQIRIIHYGKNWSNLRLQNGSTVLPDSGSPIREKERYEMRGRFFPAPALSGKPSKPRSRISTVSGRELTGSRRGGDGTSGILPSASPPPCLPGNGSPSENAL